MSHTEKVILGIFFALVLSFVSIFLYLIISVHGNDKSTH